jgi:cruciform cutting endonuclease 1
VHPASEQVHSLCSIRSSRSRSPTVVLKMATTAHHALNALKSPELKRLGFLTGAHTGGTKSQLIGNLTQELRKPRLSACVPVSDGKTTARLLSIDMGIRNLAYCVLEVSDVHKFGNGPDPAATLSDHLRIPTRPESLLYHLRVTSWKRVVVNENTVTTSDEQVNKTGDVAESTSKIETTAFEPIAYAKLAYGLVARLLRAYQPTTIIIERQRWRSGGASSVLEWTIRVNMFEGMIHSALETLRQQWHERRLGSGTMVDSTSEDEKGVDGDVLATLTQFPDVYSASPKRVFDYWADREAGENGDHDIGGVGKGEEEQVATDGISKALVKQRKVLPSKLKAQKQLKIGIVESWLRGVARPDDVEVDGAAASVLECTGGAAQIRDAFLQKLSKQKGRVAPTGKGQQKQKVLLPANAATVDKLDDLADCLLQGVTWVQWERNRQAMCASPDALSLPGIQETQSPPDERKSSASKTRRGRIKRA